MTSTVDKGGRRKLGIFRGGMSAEAVRQSADDRVEWRALQREYLERACLLKLYDSLHMIELNGELYKENT